MITRDLVQGFIDGHKLSHGNNCLDACAKKWMKEHHTYPQTEEVASKIVTDLGSYKK